MTGKCFDIGIIQAFLDGELAVEQSETVSRHISMCDDCAVLLAEAEEETTLAFAALEQEFNTLVPTQRLWTKINDSIEREKKSFWKPIFAFLLQPSTAAFASLLFVFAVVVALLSMKPNAPTNYTAQTKGDKQNIKQPVTQNQQSPNIEVSENTPEKTSVENVASKPNKTDYRAVKTIYAEENKPRRKGNSLSTGMPETDVTPIRNESENVLGEESYIKTITTLSETVSSRKDEVLTASARFAFERDMAVTDDAIKKMRKEIKQNPKNEAAKQVLRASYQNKIDLLNSVAEKTELMASLK